MNLVTRNFAGTWGFDTSWPITPALAKRIAAATIPDANGVEHPIAFVVQYVSPFGPEPHTTGDITADNAKGIWGAGLGLVLVGHPRIPKSNILSDVVAASDAKWMIRNALAAGYDPGRVQLVDGAPWLVGDMEGVKNPGPDSQAYALRLTSDVRGGAFGPALYYGFDWGVSNVIVLGSDVGAWCDFAPLVMRPGGPKQPPLLRGAYDLRQHPQSTVCGIGADVDEAPAGGFCVGIVDADVNVVTSDAAAQPAP